MQNATANATDLNLCYLVFVAAIINSTVLLTMSEECPHEFNAHPAYKAINARIRSAELFCRCFRLQMKLRSAVSWRVHTPVFSATNPSRCYLLEIYADCRIAHKMPVRCGAAVCSAKNSQTCRHNQTHEGLCAQVSRCATKFLDCADRIRRQLHCLHAQALVGHWACIPQLHTVQHRRTPLT